METAFNKQIELIFNTVPKATKKALDFLSKQSWLGQDGWYLAGGTALAVQAGHRVSVDLDFFTIKKDFDKTELLKKFSGQRGWKINLNKKNTIYGQLFKAKVSFIPQLRKPRGHSPRGIAESGILSAEPTLLGSPLAPIPRGSAMGSSSSRIRFLFQNKILSSMARLKF